MARVVYAAAAFADLERLTDFLLESEPEAATETVELIMAAIEVLQDHPLIGRPAEGDLFELVISRGRSGYVALYCVEDEHKAVLILAIRHQREMGYSDAED